MALLSWLSPRRRAVPWYEAVNIGSREFKADPFPFYARLRAERPVCRIWLPTNEPAWLIARYDDAAAALRDERFVKDKRNGLTPLQIARQPWFRRIFSELHSNMLDRDPPDHTRLRALVQKAFTPRLIEQMRGRVEALTNDLVTTALRRGRMDLIRDYALPLPTTIIAEMLGIPAQDRHRFHRWSSSLIAAGASTWGMVQAVPNAMALLRYLRRIVRQRRAAPQDDLISDLIRVEETGATLREDEVVPMVFLLLVAGHETTVNLIGNGMLALLEHPEQWQRLRHEPELLKSAVEELLRFTSPVETGTLRFAREEVTVAGTTIPQGELVFPAIASANRDETQFANADTLDIAREPNRHLSFGLGPHFCLGAALARLEAQVAIGTLLSQAPQLRLAQPPGSLRWRRGLIVRGLESLPVELT